MPAAANVLPVTRDTSMVLTALGQNEYISAFYISTMDLGPVED
jgi:hypothetical protein